jgi:hypothetical protein
MQQRHFEKMVIYQLVNKNLRVLEETEVYYHVYTVCH